MLLSEKKNPNQPEENYESSGDGSREKRRKIRKLSKDIHSEFEELLTQKTSGIPL